MSCHRAELGRASTEKGPAVIAWADCGSLDGSFSLVAGTASGELLELSHSGSRLRSARTHDGPVLALAASPSGDFLASCGRDKAARLTRADGLCLDASLGDFPLPPRCLAFSPLSDLVALAGDSEHIKVCDALTGRHSFSLDHSRRPIKALSFDPSGEFLAIAEEDGSVAIFQASDNGERVALLPALATPAAAGDPTPVTIDWRPGDGSLLAVPARGRIAFIERSSSWKESFAVQSESGSLSKYGLVRWSPNGLFLAAAGAGQNYVCLHDMRPGAKGRELRTVDALAPVACFSWHPDANTLALANAEGSLSLWNACVPDEECPAPYTPLENLSRADLYVADDDNDDEDEGENNDNGDYIDGEYGGGDKGLMRSDGLHGATESESDDAAGAGRLVYGGGGYRKKRSGAMQNAVMQKPFQPGSTGNETTKQQRFMAYDLNGFMVQRTDESTGTVLVETCFHDASRLRIPAIAGADGYTIGALEENGIALAGGSEIRYRPFEGWSPDAEWRASLPSGESPTCIAVGQTFIAAATSANVLRLFCTSGLQLHVSSLEGPPVCACADGKLLAIIWHSAPPLTDASAVRATQQLRFSVIDTASMTERARGPVALSPGGHLCWAGFSATGHLCVHDSEGVVRMRVETLGGSWMPIFRSEDAKELESEKHQVVGVTESEIVYVVCPPHEGEPSVLPRPVHSLKDLSLPLAQADGTEASLENKFALEQSKLLEAEANGKHAEASKLRASGDQKLIRLFAEACKGGRQSRARGIAERLQLTKSIDGAWKLANKLRMPALAEEMRRLSEQRSAAVTGEITTPAVQPIASKAASHEGMDNAEPGSDRKRQALGEPAVESSAKAMKSNNYNNAAPNPYARA